MNNLPNSVLLSGQLPVAIWLDYVTRLYSDIVNNSQVILSHCVSTSHCAFDVTVDFVLIAVKMTTGMCIFSLQMLNFDDILASG